MDKEEKRKLNYIFVLLESINWQGQTTVARDKWQTIRHKFKELDLSLK